MSVKWDSPDYRDPAGLYNPISVESLRTGAADDFDVYLRTGSDYFSDDANTPNRRIDGSTVVNFRGAHSVGRFAIFAYARNAFNAFYLTNLATSTFGTAGDPRQVGIGVETRF